MKVSQRAPMPVDHGDPNTYGNRGCRCDACREAWREYMRQYTHRTGRHRPVEVVRAERRAAVQHGTQTKYAKHGCRCDECREWARRARAHYRAKAKAGPAHRRSASDKDAGQVQE